MVHRLSSCGLWTLEHRLSSRGAQALLLRNMWDHPRPQLEPMSPELVGRVLTTVPPGKSQCVFLFWRAFTVLPASHLLLLDSKLMSYISLVISD